MRALIAALVATAAVVAWQANAQASGEITLHSRGDFSGARYSIMGPSRSLRVPFVVRSVSIPPGSAWELCSGNTFTGCRQFSESTSAIAMTVRSARPVAAATAVVRPVPSAETAAVAGIAPGQPSSLRGMTSEYFVSPEEGGSLIEVRPGTGEATSRRADEFCRARGWRSSAYQRLQTADGRFYLADVLCSDSGD